jgi:short-subunit dehydrogenase
MFTEALRFEHRTKGVHFSAVLPTFPNTQLVAGTRGAKGLKNAEPEDIANAIVALIRRPKRRVAVTRVAGLVVSTAKWMPGPVAESIGRRFGIEHAFLDDVDRDARKAYEDRARGLEG